MNWLFDRVNLVIFGDARRIQNAISVKMLDAVDLPKLSLAHAPTSPEK